MPAIMFTGKITVEGGPPRNATMVGNAEVLQIWSDPIMPGPPVDPGYGVPEGGPPRPTHPIFYPPGTQPRPEHPIYFPPEPPLVIWGPTDPRPSLPIYWPGFPAWPPTEPSPEPPPANKWTWQYDDELGWVLVPPGGGGKPQPVP